MPRYDRFRRKRAQRRNAERGVWVYIPAVELVKAGVDTTQGEPPFYRVWGSKRGSCLLRFYREP